MSEKEKQVVEKLKEAIPQMSDLTRAISSEKLRAWQSRKKKIRRKRNDCNKNHFNCIAIFAFVMCILSCIENESKALGFWIVLWLICTILKYAVC